ncbi:hypothetical protein ACS0TY_013743 [Phlomoides rotata]
MGAKIHRTMVDTGAYANIMFKSTSFNWENSAHTLRDATIRFEDLRTPSQSQKESNNLETTVVKLLDFIIVNQSSSYNCILGWPFITEFNTVVSTYNYYYIKFPCGSKGGGMKGGQMRAR